jgi:hypothetical protein
MEQRRDARAGDLEAAFQPSSPNTRSERVTFETPHVSFEGVWAETDWALIEATAAMTETGWPAPDATIKRPWICIRQTAGHRTLLIGHWHRKSRCVLQAWSAVDLVRKMIRLAAE